MAMRNANKLNLTYALNTPVIAKTYCPNSALGKTALSSCGPYSTPTDSIIANKSVRCKDGSHNWG